MQSYPGRLSNNGDDELMRLLSFDCTPLNGFPSEYPDLRFPAIRNQCILSLAPPFQHQAALYDSDDRLGFCPTPNLTMSIESARDGLMCFTGATPAFAPNAMPSTDNVVVNRCNAASLSLVAPFPEAPRNHPNTSDIDAARFVRNISQINKTQQPSSPSGIREELVVAENYLATERSITSVIQNSLSDSLPKVKCNSLSSASSASAKRQVRKNRPKRALTAYNLFFKEERKRILEERRLSLQTSSCGSKHGERMCNCIENSQSRVGFEEMGKLIGQRWQELDRDLRRRYEARVQAEKQRYQEELAEYLLNERNERETKFAALQASVSEDTKHHYFSTGK